MPDKHQRLGTIQTLLMRDNNSCVRCKGEFTREDIASEFGNMIVTKIDSKKPYALKNLALKHKYCTELSNSDIDDGEILEQLIELISNSPDRTCFICKEPLGGSNGIDIDELCIIGTGTGHVAHKACKM